MVLSDQRKMQLREKMEQYLESAERAENHPKFRESPVFKSLRDRWLGSAIMMDAALRTNNREKIENVWQSLFGF
jgi:hypothetical protein